MAVSLVVGAAGWRIGGACVFLSLVLGLQVSSLSASTRSGLGNEPLNFLFLLQCCLLSLYLARSKCSRSLASISMQASGSLALWAQVGISRGVPLAWLPVFLFRDAPSLSTEAARGRSVRCRAARRPRPECGGESLRRLIASLFICMIPLS